MSQPGGDDDDRATPRAPIELRVEYQRLNTFFADYTKNICKGGTFIRTKKPLEIGTEFIFKLFVPKLGEPIAIRGAVQWVVEDGGAPAPDAGGPEAGMGIRFLYRDDGERSEVERLVEKMMIDNLGRLLFTKLMAKGGKAPGPDGPEGGAPDPLEPESDEEA